MNRLVVSITQKCARLSISPAAHFHSPSSSLVVPPVPRGLPRSYEMPDMDRTGAGPTPQLPFTCPGLDNVGQVYTFPTLNRAPILAPAPFLQQIVEKMDPELNKSPIEAPSAFPNTAMYAAPRLLTIRRKKMKKHKRRKRYDRDFFKYQKYHREKKLRAEREFTKRMKAHLAELEAFDPEKYVEDTIARAKREWSDELAPTGRRLYPHWSRLMSLEELYGIPKSDYIDKRAGLSSEEDRERIKQLRDEYRRQFLGQVEANKAIDNK